MSIFSTVKNYSSLIEDGRTQHNVLAYTMTEVGELAEEIIIQHGHSYKDPGVDGVIGEAVDVIICALDMINISNPQITEDEILEIVIRKCKKWRIKTNERQQRDANF
jgi:NTP pyrophosphatase (non-canonical NTP hydrolase)